jgi:hypothetical protein
MNYAHIHLILNHIPALAMMFGLLILIYGFLRKSTEVKQTALGIFVLAALMTIPVYLTGEPAEEIVENLAGVSEAFIESHEDSALYALVLMQFAGTLALLNLIFFRRKFATKLLIITMLSSFFAVGSILWTANLGGKIRHPEIRGNSANQSGPLENRTEGKEDESDEDEDDDDGH